MRLTRLQHSSRLDRVMQIAVVGAGVIGLSCGIRLRERGHAVTVFAAQRTPHTTSDRAAAVFSPFRAGEDGRVHQWTLDSYAVFTDLARRPQDGHGVSLGFIREYFFEPQARDPWWRTLVQEYRRLSELPSGYGGGVEALMPRMDMIRYLPYLERRFTELGGAIVIETVPTLGDVLARGYPVVINCSGLGARELAHDTAVRPMRGQIMHVPNDLGLTVGLADEGRGAETTYVLPFEDHVVLGGTYEEDAPLAETDEVTLAAVVDRCRTLLRHTGHPRWAELGTRRLRAWAGLRPMRKVGDNPETVRLEVEELASGTVIHNYGHGRVGVTLSWGTAAEVVRLVTLAST